MVTLKDQWAIKRLHGLTSVGRQYQVVTRHTCIMRQIEGIT